MTTAPVDLATINCFDYGPMDETGVRLEYFIETSRMKHEQCSTPGHLASLACRQKNLVEEIKNRLKIR
jgi:hypothetical protein